MRASVMSLHTHGVVTVLSGPEAEAVTPPLRLVNEERISFGINPAVTTVTTVAQIRDDFNEVDCRLIAKEVKGTPV